MSTACESEVKLHIGQSDHAHIKLMHRMRLLPLILAQLAIDPINVEEIREIRVGSRDPLKPLLGFVEGEGMEPVLHGQGFQLTFCALVTFFAPFAPAGFTLRKKNVRVHARVGVGVDA